MYALFNYESDGKGKTERRAERTKSRGERGKASWKGEVECEEGPAEEEVKGEGGEEQQGESGRGAARTNEKKGRRSEKG
jgi:hypothetical protein